MGIVRAYQKGTLKGKATPEVQGAASSMKKKDVKKFASTKHKGLPEKKVTKESFNEDYVKELEDGLVKMDYPTYDEVDKLMCKIAKENDIDTTTLHMAFKTKHLMVPDDWAKKKMMEPVMIPKTPQITGDVKEGVTAKERFKRDAGKIAKNKLRQKEHEKYVNFLNVDESLDKDDKPFVKKLVNKLRKGSKTHAKQADDLETAMNESSHSKQQAAIAISKRKRLEDMMVKRKKKLKEAQEHEGMKYSDKKKIERQEQLKKASAKAPVVKNKIVPLHKESSYEDFEKKSGVKAVKPKKETELPKTPKKEPANTYASGNPVGKENVKRKMLNVSPGSKREVASRGILGKIKHVLTGEEYAPAKEETINELSGETASAAYKAANKKYQYADNNETKKRANRQAKKFSSYADKKYRELIDNKSSLNKLFNKPSAKRETNEGNLHEDDGNYHMNKIAKEKGLDLTDPRQRRRANSLARHNAAKGNVNNPAGFSKRKKKKRKNIQTEGNLHKWFKGSKSKDGKGGWVNVVTGGTCASDEPGEGTPKCVSSSKRASMTKAERLSASRRKKKADPNQQSKSGAAKPTYVSTDKKKVKKESYIPEEGYDHIKDRIAMAGGDPSSKDKKDATTIKKNYKDYKRKVKGDTAYQKQKRKEYGGRMPSALEIVKADIKKKYGKGAIMGEGKDLSGKHEKGDKPIKVNLKDLVNKAKNNPKNKNLGVKPPTDITEKKVMGKIKKSFKRDEYGDPIKPDGSYAGKLNIDKNPKDEKITRSEGYVLDEAKVTTNYATTGGEHAKDKKASETGVITSSDHKNKGFKIFRGKAPIRGRELDIKAEPIERNPKRKGIKSHYTPDMSMVEDMSGMSQKSGDKRSTESGAGMTAAGVAKYNRRTGGNLKTAVTGKVKRGSKAAKRRKSFCARSKGWTGERGKAARRRWKCNNSVDYMFELEHGEILNERGPQTLGSGARQSSIHAKKGKKSTKKVSGMIKSLKRKGSILKQSMGPLDASRKALRLKNLKDDVDLKLFSIFMNEGHMNKTCGEGEYYCYQSKKCKKIPKGMKIGYGGMLKPEKDDSEETKGKNGNGNGNGNGHGGNGNGNGNGGGDGGGE